MQATVVVAARAQLTLATLTHLSTEVAIEKNTRIHHYVFRFQSAEFDNFGISPATVAFTRVP